MQGIPCKSRSCRSAADKNHSESQGAFGPIGGGFVLLVRACVRTRHSPSGKRHVLEGAELVDAGVARGIAATGQLAMAGPSEQQPCSGRFNPRWKVWSNSASSSGMTAKIVNGLSNCARNSSRRDTPPSLPDWKPGM